MNLTECPKCRVTSEWRTGSCPVCPAPRMPVDAVLGVWRQTDPLEQRNRVLDRSWRSAATVSAVDWLELELWP